MDEHVEIGNIVEGDARILIADLQNNQISSKSSSEDEKIRSSSEDEKFRSSSEDEKRRDSSDDEKCRDSSEEDEKRKSVEYEKRKRENSDEGEFKGKKRVKYCEGGRIYWSFHDGVYTCPAGYESTSDYDPDANEDDDDEPVDQDVNRDDDDSYFTKEELESTEVKPEECVVELTAEEQKFYIDDEYGGMWSHWATKAELKALDQGIDESEGFDVPFLPYSQYHGTRRTNLTLKKIVICVVKCAKFALKFYNNKYESDFKFDRLVMSATKPCAGFVYSVTFMATSESTEYTETFQTRAFVLYTGNLHIMMCRIKNDDNQPHLKSTSASRSSLQIK